MSKMNEHRPAAYPRKAFPRWRLQSIAGGITVALALTFGLTPLNPAIAGPQPDFPTMRFAGKSKGAEAVKRLGAHIGKVAEWYGITPERLAEILQADPHARLDETGHLLYVEEFPPPPEQIGTVDDSGSTLTPGPYPLAQTFQLHSKPDSKRVIYLDFDGHSTTGSAWNSGTISRSSRATAPCSKPIRWAAPSRLLRPSRATVPAAW